MNKLVRISDTIFVLVLVYEYLPPIIKWLRKK